MNFTDPSGLVFKGYNPNIQTSQINYVSELSNGSDSGSQNLTSLSGGLPDPSSLSGYNQSGSTLLASGTLIINSNGSGDGSSGSGGLSGHSWISYTPDGGGTTTYGTWGPKSNPAGEGLLTDQELKFRPADATRSTHINDAQETKLYGVISDYGKRGASGWGYLSPCSSFASDAWKASTGESLNPNGPYSNPSSLKNSIINANGGVNNLGRLPSN